MISRGPTHGNAAADTNQVPLTPGHGSLRVHRSVETARTRQGSSVGPPSGCQTVPRPGQPDCRIPDSVEIHARKLARIQKRAGTPSSCNLRLPAKIYILAGRLRSVAACYRCLRFQPHPISPELRSDALHCLCHQRLRPGCVVEGSSDRWQCRKPGAYGVEVCHIMHADRVGRTDPPHRRV